MRQVFVQSPTYTGDVSGVCSALYELGGMVVIHDPSGCNSTYNTHDEPRWYDQDSLVFITGLSEMDAVMGDDEKVIEDVVRAAQDFSPRFIALVRTPVPLMIGTDFEAIASEVHRRTGLPVFSFPTTGMGSYVRGAGMAMETVARSLVPEDREEGPHAKPLAEKQAIPVTVLGATPLDFSVGSSLESLMDMLRSQDFCPVSCLTQNTSPDAVAETARARVSLVVSSVGLPAARVLRERFGIPYVAGFPTGDFGSLVFRALKDSAADGKNRIAWRESGAEKPTDPAGRFCLIGEPVMACSLRAALFLRYGQTFTVLSPVETENLLLDPCCLQMDGEEEMREHLKQAKLVIADPLHRPQAPADSRFIALPHEACSGRCFRGAIPDLTRPFSTKEFEKIEAFFRQSSCNIP